VLAHLGLVADGDDRPSPHGHGGRERLARIECPDTRADDGEVGGHQAVLAGLAITSSVMVIVVIVSLSARLAVLVT
jgi:hypothetical protein